MKMTELASMNVYPFTLRSSNLEIYPIDYIASVMYCKIYVHLETHHLQNMK